VKLRLKPHISAKRFDSISKEIINGNNIYIVKFAGEVPEETKIANGFH
jgi:hypothetical protein